MAGAEAPAELAYGVPRNAPPKSPEGNLIAQLSIIAWRLEYYFLLVTLANICTRTATTGTSTH